MALSMGNPLIAVDIGSITRFKEGKVVLLKGYGFDSLVIKIEMASESHVKSATTVVKAVDPSNRMKLLSASEIQELQNFYAHQTGMLLAMSKAEAKFGAHKWTVERVLASHPALSDLRDMLGEYQHSTGAGAALCKMDQANLVGMDKALVARWTNGETEQDPLNQFKSSLLARGGMERLGEIVAADLFIANRDRFNVSGGPWTAWIDEHGPNERKLSGMKTFHNIGNILLCLKNDGPVMSGLDYVDPNGQGGGMNFKDWNGVTATEQLIEVTWDGRILADKAKRRQLAKNVVDDIDWLLQACPTPRQQNRVVFPGNGTAAEKSLEKGMIDGCRKICSKLKNKIKQYERDPNKTRFVAGVSERYRILKGV